MTSEDLRGAALVASALASGAWVFTGIGALKARSQEGASRPVPVAAMGFTVVASLLLGECLRLRGHEVGHAPFQTIYEVLLYTSLCTCLCLLVVLGTNGLLGGTPHRTAVGGLLGALCMGLVVTMAGPGMDLYGDTGLDLPPALQSAFFVPHVMVYVCGYGAALVAAAAAALQLLASWEPVETRLGGPQVARELDLVAYRNVALAFPLLSLGLGLGTAWAWYAWSDYWGWDNKEVWALVSWLIFVVYLHLRRVSGWKGRRSSWFILAGGAAIVFTLLIFGYLPASYFSVHRYAG